MSPCSIRGLRWIGAAAFVLGLFVGSGSAGAFQTRQANSNATSQAAHAAAKNAMDAAKKQFDDATKRVNDLRPKHQQAEAELNRERRGYQQAREAAEQQFEQDPQLVRAREKHAGAKRAYDDERSRVIAFLKSRPAYQAALKAQREAKDRHDSPAAQELSDEVRKTLAKEEFQATAEVRRLEEQAVNQDSAARTAHERKLETGEELAKLVKHRDAEVNRNSRVASGKTAFEKANEAEQVVHRELQAALATAAQAQRAYQAASNAFAMLEAQERQQQQAARARSLRGRRIPRPR